MIASEYGLNFFIEEGILTEAQANAVQRRLEETDNPLLIVIENMGFASVDSLLQLLASEYGMEVMDISDYNISQDVIESIDAKFVRENAMIPLMKDDYMLTIATSDPTRMDAIDSLRYRLKLDIETILCHPKQIQEVIEQHYSSENADIDTFLSTINEEGINLDELVELNTDTKEEGEDSNAPIIRLTSLMLIEAYRSRASDIHLEPLERRFRIRLRVDGVLHEIESPPKYLEKSFISRIKIMANLNIAEKRLPQDGRILFDVPGKKNIDFRVSVIPSVHGESIVLRILDKSSIMLGFSELGLFGDDQDLIRSTLSCREGIFLSTGPTGSGKTTSLYAFLNQLNTKNYKIITAEDPVEYELSGINQVQVNSSIKLDFVTILRSMLRQAPNIIMVGEIRDLETVTVAIQASLTGHFVFSTLHTNDAPTAITRLLNIGVKPYFLPASLRMVMAQRLVRRICVKCRKSSPPTEAEKRLLRLNDQLISNNTFYKGEGCGECKEGYSGRIGIYEILEISEDKKLIDLILERASTNRIRKRAQELGMRSLLEDALRKVADGLTSLEEIIRVIAFNMDTDGVDHV